MLIFTACETAGDKQVYARLQQWDSLLLDNPHGVKDSLRQIHPEQLSRSNRAYLGLIQTIVDDKTYADFTSDSLINAVEEYYAHHDKGSENHIRSLIYQGMVRFRMNETDTLIWQPLKEAEKRWNQLPQKNPLLGYFLNMYLGEIHSNNDNDSLANIYFRKALKCARQQPIRKYVFDAYYKLFIEEMKQEHYPNAKNYLDTLSAITNLPMEQQYTLLNAQSIYYDEIREYQKALDAEKKQIIISNKRLFPIEMFKSYYTISHLYLSLNQPDSAMHYGLEAIRHIKDSTYMLNYLLYQNIEDIAMVQKDYQTAHQYARKALEVYESSVDKIADKQILELEKRYDLSEAENKVLKAKSRNIIYVVLLILLTLLIIIGVFHFKRKRIIDLLRLQQTEDKNRSLELEKKLIVSEIKQREEMLSIFGNFLAEYGQIQNRLYGITNRIKTKDTSLGEEYENELKMSSRNFQTIAEKLFSHEKLNQQFDIDDAEHILSPSDRMLIFMLSKQIPNDQIAALLNTSTHSLKTRKSVLKKKIVEKVSPDNRFEHLLPLFAKY